MSSPLKKLCAINGFFSSPRLVPVAKATGDRFLRLSRPPALVRAFAARCSLKQTTRLGLVLLLVSALFCRLPAAAQEEEDLEQELNEEFELLQQGEEEMVFSASLHRQKRQFSPSSITVITRSQIETAGTFSVVDLLRRVPGMEVIVVSPGFSSVNARIPTTLENHLFLVLIDGRQANIWFWGQAAWELQPFSIDDIERIEIIRGPASAVYGSNAVGGVISITTRAVPRQTTASASFQGGSWSRVETSGRVSTNLGRFGFSASAGYDYSGESGFSDVLGKEFLKGRALVEYEGDDLLLRLDVSGGQGRGILPSVIGRFYGTQEVLAANLSFARLAWRAQANYTYSHFLTGASVPLELHGLRLANISSLDVGIHDLEAGGQLELPNWWEPLTLILGSGLRVSWLACPHCLDGRGYADPTSTSYHRPGAEYRELRLSGFLHTELEPLVWIQLSASGRADYNTDSGFFFSPRLAAVAEPMPGHFLRLSGARAFRKLTYLERHLHPLVTFPEGSPLQGGDQTLFLEFMSRTIGNENLPDETLWALEAGYEWVPSALGLEAGLCVYFNLYGNQSSVLTEIQTNAQGLPDLRASSARYELGNDNWIVGVEAWAKYSPLDWLALRASWSYRHIMIMPEARKDSASSDQLYALGAEFFHPEGVLGSIYLSGRSDLHEGSIDNPRGLLEQPLRQHLPHTLLVLARLGCRIEFQGLQIENGIKFMLPVNLENGAPNFYEHGGGVTPEGKFYGGTQLRPSLLFYANGSF